MKALIGNSGCSRKTKRGTVRLLSSMRASQTGAH
jgi:hypothetical protein